MQEFRDIINKCELFDPGYIGAEFTWCNNHVNGEMIWERLDRFLMDAEMQNKCSSVKVFHLPCVASDHRPIMVEWHEDRRAERNRGTLKIKRFEEMWVKYEDCKNIVRSVWQECGHRRHNSIIG